MSNFKKSILVILIAIVIPLANGCKKDDNPTESGDDLVGTWVLTKLIVATPQGNMEMTPQEANMTQTLIINSNKTYQMTMVSQGETQNDSGTWSVANGKMTVTSTLEKPVTFTYRLIGNKLQLDMTMADPETGQQLAMTLEYTKQ